MSLYLQEPLYVIAFTLGITLVATLLIPAEGIESIRLITLLTSISVLFYGLLACLSFDKGVTGFQFIDTLSVI
jgi:hypothetical protein